MQRPIASIHDLAPAYRELPNKWLKVLFWALVPIGIVLAAALAVFLWQRFFPKEPSKVARDAKVKQFVKRWDTQQKKTAQLVKQREKIIKKGEKVGHDAKQILDDIDMIEVFNARNMFNRPDRKLLNLSRKLGVVPVVSSDAHLSCEIGRATMVMESYSGPEDFLDKLRKARCFTRKSPLWVHAATKFIRMNRTKRSKAK